MTLSTTTTRNDYSGSGSAGPFSYTFKIFDATHLVVTKASTTGVETTLSYPTDYSVSGVGSASGGSITLGTALASGEHLTIRRVMPLTQTTDLRNQGSFLPASEEDALDVLAMGAQGVQEQVDRALQLPPTVSPSDVSPVLPRPSAGQVLVWSDDEDALENRGVDSAAAVLPGDSRTVATLTDYLANNAVFNAHDYGAAGDGTTDDTVALQLLLDSGRDVHLKAGKSYRVTSSLALNTSGQRVVGHGATITAVGATTSIFSIGNDGTGTFVKTDDVTIEDVILVGGATGSGSPSAPPYAIGVLGPSTVPYSEGIGCSRITVRNVRASGFCFGVTATGADHLTVTGCSLGGMFYYASLGAGGYGVLPQTCFHVRVAENAFTATTTDRHAVYISADPNRTFDDNNVCKDVTVTGNTFDWTSASGVTGFEAPLEIRSAHRMAVTGNAFHGGYGGIDYDAENGNGHDVTISGNTFDGQKAGVSSRACVTVTRSSGSYVTSGVAITGNTFRPSGTNMYAVAVSAVSNVTVTGNVGVMTAGIAMVGISGSVTGLTVGANTWTVDAVYVYEVSGASNSAVTWGANLESITGGGARFHFLTTPTSVRFTTPRAATVNATSTATPTIGSDADAIVASVANHASGLSVTLADHVTSPAVTSVFAYPTNGSVAFCAVAIAGQVATITVKDAAGAALPGASNTYTLAILVTA